MSKRFPYLLTELARLTLQDDELTPAEIDAVEAQLQLAESGELTRQHAVTPKAKRRLMSRFGLTESDFVTVNNEKGGPDERS